MSHFPPLSGGNCDTLDDRSVIATLRSHFPPLSGGNCDTMGEVGM